MLNEKSIRRLAAEYKAILETAAITDEARNYYCAKLDALLMVLEADALDEPPTNNSLITEYIVTDEELDVIKQMRQRL